MAAKEFLTNKKQLITLMLQTIENFVPLETRPASEGMAIYLYELKKEILRQDSQFKFINSYNDYVFRILTLLDYLDVSKEYDTEDHGKTVHMICRETRDIRRIDPLWTMDKTSVIKFIDSTLSTSAE
jgi:radical SAM superfamily enzyme